MKILFFLADPYDVIQARNSLIGAEIAYHACFVEEVNTLKDLKKKVKEGVFIGKEEILECIYELNHLNWDEVARKVHYLECNKEEDDG